MTLASLALAWLRSRRVAIVAVVISAFGVTAMITVVALMDGIQRFLEGHLKGVESDLSVFHDFRGGLPDGHWAEAQRTFAPHRADKGGPIVGMAPRSEEQALVWLETGASPDESAEEIVGARLIGVRLSAERQLTRMGAMIDAVEDGELRVRGELKDDALLPDASGVPGILLGDDLAARLGAVTYREGKSNGMVRLAVARLDVDSSGAGNPTDLDRELLKQYVTLQSFRVVGAMNSRREDFDATTAWVDLDALRRLSYRDPNGRIDCQRIHLRLRDPERTDAVKEMLEERYPQWNIRGWRGADGGELGAIEDQKRIFVVILSFITIAGSAGICGMVYTMVREKTRDIGILRSMGLSRRRMVTSFTLYGLFLGLLGAGIGLGLGVLLTSQLDTVIAWASDVLGVPLLNPEVYPFETVPTHLEPLAVATILLATVVMSFLAALLPALRAGTLSPVRALRAD